MKRAIIVGAGFAGLSSAAQLSKRGYDVTIVERNSAPGGRAMVWESSGFRFDMGPSWYLMPEVFERFFSQFGRTTTDYYQLQRLDPAYRVFFAGNKQVDVSSSLEANVRLFDSFEPKGGAKFLQYLEKSKYKYDVAMREFLYKTYSSLFDFLNYRLLTEGPRLRVFSNLDRYVSRLFQSDEARKILLYTTVFLGGDPKATPALYSIMAHVDFHLGVWYPLGGMASVVDGLVTLNKQLGVKFIHGADVTGVRSQYGRVSAVQTTSGEIPADVLLVTGDYPTFELEVLQNEQRTYSPRYWSSRVLAPSALLMYLGVNRRIPELAHHNLYFAKNWDRHFHQIFQAPTWADDPSYYVSCPSRTDESVAPAGKENVFVLVPLAPGLDDRDDIREQYAERVLTHLEQLIDAPLREHLEVKRLFSHRDFSSVFRAYRGTALGMAHTLRQSAFFRPSHRSKKINGLYYAGQYTHPGVGVPMTLIAAEIVSDLIEREQGNGESRTSTNI